MKRKLALVVALAVLAFSGCGRRVERVGLTEEIDLSGRWNDTDSRLVSEEMISDCLSRPWLENHITETGENPTVIVGTVINRTDEHIISETFTKDLERAFINSGKVNVVTSGEAREEIRREREDMQRHASEETMRRFMQEEGADYMLQGTVNDIIDQEGRRSVRYYQVNLELVNTETNRKVWIGDKSIRKYIRE